jgi:hypothetical protein
LVDCLKDAGQGDEYVRAFLGLVGLFLCLNLSGCKHSVRFETTPPNGYLTVDGQSLGKVSPEGLSAQMSSGYGPTPYRLVYVDGFERSGMLPRSGVDGVLTTLALLGPLVCAPMLCGLGVCVVNPGWGVALLSGSVTSVGACQGLMTVASPWTMPTASLLGSLGFIPAGLLLKAERLPDRVVIEKVPGSRGPLHEVMPF